MVGVDLTDIERFAEMKNEEAFLARVFTAAEQAYIAGKKNRAETMAGMFAAKEAVSKALGTGIGGEVRLTDIEILHRASGAPYVELHGGAELALAQDIEGTRVELSISHGRAQAVAFAVIV